MPDFKDVKKEMKFLMKKLDIFEQEKYEQEKQSCFRRWVIYIIRLYQDGFPLLKPCPAAGFILLALSMRLTLLAGTV